MTEQQACTLCGAGGHTAAQCNWNQGSADFQREERYVVAKISKMHPHPTFRRRQLESLKRELSGALVDCVVVERDWPEYETVWRMIEARVTGQAGPMVECPHRCGSVFSKESYGAGFIEGSGMCPACDAAMPAKDIARPGDEPTPPELLAAKLIDTWRVVHGRPVPWEKAVEITAIATSMNNEERERLLALADAPVAQAGQVPEECPHLILFDDADVKPIMFAGSGARRAALAKWEQVSINWNAHLFVRIEKNCRDDRYPCAMLAAAPPQRGE